MVNILHLTHSFLLKTISEKYQKFNLSIDYFITLTDTDFWLKSFFCKNSHTLQTELRGGHNTTPYIYSAVDIIALYFLTTL